jgi:hypothetical protein
MREYGKLKIKRRRQEGKTLAPRPNPSVRKGEAMAGRERPIEIDDSIHLGFAISLGASHL